MSFQIPMHVIAHIHNDFSSKFGIPRQSGLVDTKSQIIFEPEFRNQDAIRGLEGYSHIWLLWQFSKAVREEWTPTVRPPRLGGNVRMGVFATRSPFRPNAIGLSSVRLERIEQNSKYGPVLHVVGADLMDGSPIFDIKPYLPYTDSHPEATSGFAFDAKEGSLQVDFPEDLLSLISADRRDTLCAILAQDPRPAYQNTPDRVYKLVFADYEIHFTVERNFLTVHKVLPYRSKDVIK